MLSENLSTILGNNSLFRSVERGRFKSVWKSGDKIQVIILPICFVHRLLVLNH